jgi:hypothetical protein
MLMSVTLLQGESGYLVLDPSTNKLITTAECPHDEVIGNCITRILLPVTTWDVTVSGNTIPLGVCNTSDNDGDDTPDQDDPNPDDWDADGSYITRLINQNATYEDLVEVAAEDGALKQWALTVSDGIVWRDYEGSIDMSCPSCSDPGITCDDVNLDYIAKVQLFPAGVVFTLLASSFDDIFVRALWSANADLPSNCVFNGDEVGTAQSGNGEGTGRILNTNNQYHMGGGGTVTMIADPAP